MDKKTLAKLAILAKKSPDIAAQLAHQADAVSDNELEAVAAGEADQDCTFVSCVFTSECLVDANSSRRCKTESDDTTIRHKGNG